jgi:glycosyltransferase involved in cell wall biosynthesis
MRIALLTSDSREVLRDYTPARPTFGTAPEALLQGFADPSAVEVHVISCLQQPVVSPEKLAENIWYHALHVPKIGWLRTGYQGCIRAVRTKLDELKVDLAHGQGTERDCAISAVLSGYPNVLTVHGNMRLIAKVNRSRPLTYMWLAAKLERFTIPRSRGVVCITRYTKEAVTNLARRTWIVPNAVDSSFFSLKAKPESLPLVLCVGSIVVRKNQNAFIRALDTLQQKIPFTLCFLGAAGGKGDDYSEQFFREVQARPWCRYEGLADRVKLKSYFERASLLVLPSLEDNCPMVVLEAMAAGVPVAAAAVGGVPELITPERTGALFNPLDAESMRTAVEKILANTDFGQRVAKQASVEARQRFHPAVIAQRHIDIYREVLSSPS